MRGRLYKNILLFLFLWVNTLACVSADTSRAVESQPIENGLIITESKGWLETIYAKWKPVAKQMVIMFM